MAPKRTKPTKKKRDRGRSAPSAPRAQPASKRAPTIRSEGQLQLTRLTVSLGTIGKRIGVSRQTVHDWRRGGKTPATKARLRLQAAYAIDPGAWEIGPADPSAPAPIERAHANGSNGTGFTTAIEEIDATLRSLRDELRRPKLLVSEAVRLHDQVTKTIRLRSQLETAQALLEDRIVRDHPAWRRIRAVIVRFAERLTPADRQEMMRDLERAEGTA